MCLPRVAYYFAQLRLPGNEMGVEHTRLHKRSLCTRFKIVLSLLYFFLFLHFFFFFYFIFFRTLKPRSHDKSAASPNVMHFISFFFFFFPFIVWTLYADRNNFRCWLVWPSEKQMLRPKPLPFPGTKNLIGKVP